MVRQAVPPAAHGGPRWCRYPPVAHERPHARAGGCLKTDVTLKEAHAGAGSPSHGVPSPSGTGCSNIGPLRRHKSCQQTCAHASSLFLKDGTPWEGHTLERFMQTCSPWEGLTLEKFLENCLLWKGPHAGAGEECEEETAAETTCDELTGTTILCSPALLGGRRQGKPGVKLSLVRRVGWGEGAFKIWFHFSLSYSGLTGNKLN